MPFILWRRSGSGEGGSPPQPVYQIDPTPYPTGAAAEAAAQERPAQEGWSVIEAADAADADYRLRGS